MLKRCVMVALALVVTAVVGWQGYGWLYPVPSNLKLVFHARVGDDAFQRNAFVYQNPGGDGQFRINDFRFFLTNVCLTDGDGQTVTIPDSYHLARFDNADAAYSLQFDELAIDDLQNISFAVGVDAKTNHSIQSRGDLDPNSQMAWNWEVGYKFIVFEGNLQVGDRRKPLVYHVGFSDNLRRFSFNPGEPMDLQASSQVDFDVDVMKLFDSRNRLDMAEISSVKFNKTDARMLADNYGTMITMRQP